MPSALPSSEETTNFTPDFSDLWTSVPFALKLGIAPKIKRLYTVSFYKASKIAKNSEKSVRL
jgi:hypothetical protein